MPMFLLEQRFIACYQITAVALHRMLSEIRFVA